jgi:hypothetical protein
MDDYMIAVTDIPAELWRVCSRHASEGEALSFEGAAGEFIIRSNDDGTTVALWRWDKSSWKKCAGWE